MKSLADLNDLRDKLQESINLRKKGGTVIIVGMGTCGIAAGAREVMRAILDELAARNLNDVKVIPTGCIGMCDKEVLVDVMRPGESRITYGNVKLADVKKIIDDHIVNGRIVANLVVKRKA
ncbi:MAG: (2Fe-2S) ferredoxin domain-containing protein [Phascolarctobacterium sp.]|nr:(2Fe-2S) ferredoxin domain-containing protein [Phascolarctobacterium sp.]